MKSILRHLCYPVELLRKSCFYKVISGPSQFSSHLNFQKGHGKQVLNRYCIDSKQTSQYYKKPLLFSSFSLVSSWLCSVVISYSSTLSSSHFLIFLFPICPSDIPLGILRPRLTYFPYFPVPIFPSFFRFRLDFLIFFLFFLFSLLLSSDLLFLPTPSRLCGMVIS